MSTPATPVKEEKPVRTGSETLVPAVVEAPPSRNAETDKRVNEVLNEKKKRKHPVEARIAELTKKAADAEDARKKDREELEKKLAEQNEKNIAAEFERRKAEAAASEKRPVREDFPGDANGTSEFTAKMAEYIVHQQDKIKPKSIEVKPAEVPPDPAVQAAAKVEWDGWIEAGKSFVARNPDFNETLEAATKRGVLIHNFATVKIIKLKAPEVAYWLARPENEAQARKFTGMSPDEQVDEVVRIHERLKANPQDFISKAGKPGIPLNGNAITDVRPDEMTVEEYLRKRNQDIKSGLRRRPGR